MATITNNSLVNLTPENIKQLDQFIIKVEKESINKFAKMENIYPLNLFTNKEINYPLEECKFLKYENYINQPFEIKTVNGSKDKKREWAIIKFNKNNSTQEFGKLTKEFNNNYTLIFPDRACYQILNYGQKRKFFISHMNNDSFASYFKNQDLIGKPNNRMQNLMVEENKGVNTSIINQNVSSIDMLNDSSENDYTPQILFNNRLERHLDKKSYYSYLNENNVRFPRSLSLNELRLILPNSSFSLLDNNEYL